MVRTHEYRSHAHRRLRRRRLGRRAYIRSIQVLPSLATLGNAVCGFGAIYVSAFAMNDAGSDPWAQFLARHSFVAAGYLILLAMVFDALDGRLARFARHTTDFGGQLDSLADAVSFGAAPAFLALQVFKHEVPLTALPLSRLVWAVGAIYFSCALIRLARFNVSNEHGEQAHMSFLGLPSPGAAGAVVGLVLMQQDIAKHAAAVDSRVLKVFSQFMVALIPPLVLGTGLLMVSTIRYAHFVNKYLRGKRSIPRVMAMLAVLLSLVIYPVYTLGIGMIAFALGSPTWYLILRARHAARSVDGSKKMASNDDAPPIHLPDAAARQ
jgi:CDP-diacylglycerol---serine O-phosphatidyltransferase